MSALIRILAKDFAEFVSSPQMLIFTFLVPPVILFLVGQLSIRPAEIRLLVTGAPDCRQYSDRQSPVHHDGLVDENELAERKKAQGHLGAKFLNLELTRKQQSFSPKWAGVVVSEVETGGPAFQGGLRSGNQVLAFGGTSIDSSWQIDDIIARHNAGEKLDVMVLTYDGQRNLTIKLDEAEPIESSLLRYLSELSHVQLFCEEEPVESSLSRMIDDDIDLLLNIEHNPKEHWSLHVAETNPERVTNILGLAQGIRFFHEHPPSSNETRDVVYAANTLGAVPLQSAQLYFPKVADKSLAYLPRTFCLIVCFIGFAVAAPGLIREYEEHTLEILLAAPGVHPYTIYAAKCLFALSVSLLAAMLMLVTVQTMHQLYVKANALLFLSFLVLPVISSVFLGMTVSALARTQNQTIIAATIYFFSLLLFSGFLYIPEESSQMIQGLSHLLGLTYMLDPVNTWMFGADFSKGLWRPASTLLIQSGSYSLLAWFSWKRLLSKI